MTPEFIAYKDYVEAAGFANYQEDDYYLRIGTPAIDQGWILHVSVIVTQARPFLEMVLPELKQFCFPFKLIKDSIMHYNLNAGNFGPVKIGKVLTVFLDNVSLIEPFLERLLSITPPFGGPAVLTDLPLSPLLWTRYGSYVSRFTTDPLGKRIRVMRGHSDQILADEYYHPPLQPDHVPNPFLPFILKLPPRHQSRWIAHKVLPLMLLKSDIKGDVWKGLYIGRFPPRFCVLKEGKKYMLVDWIGRDMTDRIHWQYEVAGLFSGRIRTPDVWEQMEDAQNAYLVMRYIPHSQYLISWVRDLTKEKAWFDQLPTVQKKILDSLLQIIAMVQVLHQHGYVHRDITGTNFIVTRTGTVTAIDLELLYDSSGDTPAFISGTFGFMSPEQLNDTPPQASDDIYSLGSLMVALLTSCPDPRKIMDDDPGLFQRRLSLQVTNPAWATLLLSCTAADPAQRPTIGDVQTQVKALFAVPVHPYSRTHQFGLTDVRQTIEEGIRGIGGQLLTMEGRWISRIENPYEWETYPGINKHVFGAVHRGIGGVLWLLSQCALAGISIADAKDNINQSLSFIRTDYLSQKAHWLPSYHFGNAGMAVALTAAMQAELMDEPALHKAQIPALFTQMAPTSNIIYGVAGQLLALIQCQSYLPKDYFTAQAASYVQTLCTRQRRDGSWMEPGNQEKITGFGYGMAGIVYCLLDYGYRFHDATCIAAAHKGLAYLTRARVRHKDKLSWAISSRNKLEGAWWCQGGPGIALTYLKAFDHYPDPLFLSIAARALRTHPVHVVSYNLSQCHGLSGLGDIYLEAYRITQNQEWWDRATWIAQFLVTQKRKNNHEAYWMVEHPDVPTADLMIGGGGIIHFLCRYAQPDKFHFPLLPPPITPIINS